ncbi:MAG: PD-(D/E)XK motif protein [Deltaproteobacteria bacterium]|nr:PD-(D/E)XK motif protein [Deltaproteobacteria bacterium]
MKETLLPRFEPLEAINFWKGPIAGEGEKDFSISDTAVEIKTRAATAPSRVRINSEGQLDTGSYKRLFLVVYELSRSTGEQPESFNLDELVNHLSELIRERQPEFLELFESRLGAWGFSNIHDYKDDLFLLLGQSVYAVEGSSS